MDEMKRYGNRLIAVVVGLMVASLACSAQQGGATGEPITVQPRVFPRAIWRKNTRRRWRRTGELRPGGGN